MSYLAALAIQTDSPIQVKRISFRKHAGVTQLRLLSMNFFTFANDATNTPCGGMS